MKEKFKNLFKLMKEFKYEILMVFEVIALVSAAVYYAFGRKKQFSFLTAFSALLGAYISTSALYKINSKMKSRKFIDIIATANNKNKALNENNSSDEDEEKIIFNSKEDETKEESND